MFRKQLGRLSRWLMPAVAVLSMLVVAVLPQLANPGQAAAATAPAVRWERTFGGDHQETGECVRQTPDGGYVVAGMSQSLGGDYLVRTNSAGIKVWEKTYVEGGWLSSVEVTEDGGFILAGDAALGLYLVKTDADGVQEWEQSYAGEMCVGARPCSGGGYVIAGMLDDDLYLVKTDSDGDPVWGKTIQTDGSIYPESIEVAQDGGFVVVGYAPDGAIYLAKTDSSGDVDWQNLYAFGTNPINNGTCVKQTDDEGYVIGGFTGDFGWFDMFLIKTDSDGQPSWSRTYGDPGQNEHGEDLVLTADGGYAVAGVANDGSWRAYLVKTDSSGNPSWETVFGGSGVQAECTSVVETQDGGYVVAGSDTRESGAFEDVWLAKVGGTAPVPPVVSVDPAAQSVAAGGTFSVDIVVDPSGYGLSGGELNLAFDPAAMSVSGIVYGDLFGESPVAGTEQVNNTLGTIKYALARVGATTPPTSPGVFATITFEVKAVPGTHAIDIAAIKLADEGFKDTVAAVITDGAVTVGHPRWDINQDSVVNYKDLAMLGAAYGTLSGGAGFSANADINRDGDVNYKDLAMLGAHYGETY